MPMDPTQAAGFASFLAQTDAVGKAILAAMALMSIASWTVIVSKALALALERRRSARFLEAFWNAPSVAAVEAALGDAPAEDGPQRLAAEAIAATHHHRRQRGARLAEAGSSAEFLTRALRRTLDEQAARRESGLTLLASVGSTAPFVGLFGTVWGVYHALVAIGLSGQGTLDKVAGPVGEALIMTALGLAVAIPAVLGYNAFVRANRLSQARLEGFAHDLFTLLTTGATVDARSAAVPAPAPAAAGG